jgi:DNA-binding transcriptional regulator GbsR (MarR family)
MAFTESPAIIPRDSLVLPGDRPDEIVAFESEMVAFFVDAAELLGVPKSVAAIYGIVFASPAPLSFAEIEAKLDFSKGSVSQGLRALREIGAIREVSTTETRTELFAPDLEMRRLIQRFIEQRLDTQLEQGKKRLGGLKKTAKVFTTGNQKVISERLQKLQRWHDRTRALMPVVKTFLKLTKI